MQNWRQGTVGCQTRAEVSRTNKKPFKQKGTGRARAGSARSPLWRGGGVIFGPQPRVRTLKLSKARRNKVMNALLSSYVENSRVVYFDWLLQGDVPKTAQAYSLLKNAQLADKKITLFLPVDDLLTSASFANIPSVRVVLFDQPNAYDLAGSEYWVFLKRDLNQFKEMVARWS
jgi:large subunit ribosomal protein L4